MFRKLTLKYLTIKFRTNKHTIFQYQKLVFIVRRLRLKKLKKQILYKFNNQPINLTNYCQRRSGRYSRIFLKLLIFFQSLLIMKMSDTAIAFVIQSMQSQDKKDFQIRKLKDEVKRLLEDIEIRTRNYMYNMEQLKSNGRKIVYVYKSDGVHSQEGKSPEPMEATHVKQTAVQDQQQSTSQRICELERQLLKKGEQLAMALSELRQFKDRLSLTEKRARKEVEELNELIRKNKEQLKESKHNGKIFEERLKDEQMKLKTLQSHITMLEGEIQLFKAKEIRQAKTVKSDYENKWLRDKEVLTQAHDKKVAQLTDSFNQKAVSQNTEIDKLKKDLQQLQKNNLANKWAQEKEVLTQAHDKKVAQLTDSFNQKAVSQNTEIDKLKKDLQQLQKNNLANKWAQEKEVLTQAHDKKVAQLTDSFNQKAVSQNTEIDKLKKDLQQLQKNNLANKWAQEKEVLTQAHDKKVAQLTDSFNLQVATQNESIQRLQKQLDTRPITRQSSKIMQKGSLTEDERIMKQEIKQKIRAINILNEKVKQLQSTLQEKQRALIYQQAQFAKLEDQMRQQYEQQFNKLNGAISELNQQINNNILLRKQSEIETINLNRRIEELQASFQTRLQRESQQVANKQVQDLNELNQDNIEKLLKKDDAIISDEIKLSQLRENNILLEKEMKKLIEINEQLKKQSETFRTSSLAMGTSIYALNEKVTQLQFTNEQLTEKNGNLLRQVQSLKYKIEQQQRQMEQTRQSNSKGRETQSDKSPSLIETSSQKDNSELMLCNAKLTQQVEQLKKQIAEVDGPKQVGKQINEASQQLQYKETIQHLHDQIQKLKSKLAEQESRNCVLVMQYENSNRKSQLMMEQLSSSLRHIQSSSEIDHTEQLNHQKEQIQLLKAEHEQEIISINRKLQKLEQENNEFKRLAVAVTERRHSEKTTDDFTVEQYVEQIIKMDKEKEEHRKEMTNLQHKLQQQHCFYEDSIHKLKKEIYELKTQLFPNIQYEDIPQSSSTGQKGILAKIERQDFNLKMLKKDSWGPIDRKKSSEQYPDKTFHSHQTKSDVLLYPKSEAQMIGELEGEVGRFKKENKLIKQYFETEIKQKEQQYNIKLQEKNKQLLELQDICNKKDKQVENVTNQMEKKVKQNEAIIEKMKKQSERLLKENKESLDNESLIEKLAVQKQDVINELARQIQKLTKEKNTQTNLLRKEIQKCLEEKQKADQQLKDLKVKFPDLKKQNSLLKKQFTETHRKKDQEIMLLISNKDNIIAQQKKQKDQLVKQNILLFQQKQKIKKQNAANELKLKQGLEKLQKSYENLIISQKKVCDDNIQHQKELAQQQSNLRRLEEEIQSLKKNIQTLKLEKIALQKENEEIKTRIFDIEKQNQKLNITNKIKTDQNASLKIQIDSKAQALKFRTQKYDKLYIQLVNKTEQYENELKNNKSQVQNLKRIHQQQISRLKQEIQGFKMQIKQSQLEYTAHFGQISPIQKVQSVNISRVESSQQQFQLQQLKKVPSDMEGEQLTKQHIKTLYRRMSMIGQDNQDLKTDLAEVQAENKNLKNQLNMLDITIHNMQFGYEKKLKEKNLEADNFKQQIQKLQKQIKDLQNTNFDLQVQKANFQQELKQMQRCSRFIKDSKTEAIPEKKIQAKPEKLTGQKNKSVVSQQRSKSKTPIKQKTPIKSTSVKDQRSESQEKRIIAKQVTEQIDQYTKINVELNTKIMAEEAKSKTLHEQIERSKKQVFFLNEKIVKFKQRQQELSEINNRFKEKLIKIETQKLKEAETFKKIIESLQEKIKYSETTVFKGSATSQKQNKIIEKHIILVKTIQILIDSHQANCLKPQKPCVKQIKTDNNTLTQSPSQNLKRIVTQLQTNHKKQFEKLNADHHDQVEKLKKDFNKNISEFKETSNSNIESYKLYIGSLNQTIQNLTDKNRRSQSQALAQANKRIQILEQHLASLQRKIEEIEKNQYKVMNSAEKLSEAQHQISSMVRQISNLKAIVLEKQKSESESKQLTKQSIQGYQQQIKQLQDNLQKMTQDQCDRVQSLEKLLSQRDIEISGVQEELRVSEQQSDIIDIKPEQIKEKKQNKTIPFQVYQEEMQSILNNILILQQRHKIEQEVIDKLTQDFHVQSQIIRVLTGKLQEIENRDQSGWLIGSSESLQSEKRILKEIQEIQNIKSVKQAELEDCKNTYTIQLTAKDEEITELRKTLQELTDKSERLAIKSHDLQNDLERLKRKDQLKQEPTQVQNKEYTNLLNAYRFIEKRSQKYGQRMLQNQSDKKAMIKQVEQYKASNIKFLAQAKALEATLQQTIQSAKQQKEKVAADFKLYTDRLLQNYVVQQTKIKELKEQVQMLERSQKLSDIYTKKMEEENRQLKKSYLQKQVMQYYPKTPNPSDDDFTSAQQRTNKNFQRKFTKDPNMNQVYFFEHPVPVEVRKTSATTCVKETEKLERELHRARQELAASAQQLLVIKSNLDAREKEKTKLQLENSELVKKIDLLTKSLVILQQELGFQKVKANTEFQEFINKLAKVGWRVVEKKSVIRPRKVSIQNSNLIEQLQEQCKNNEKRFKRICDKCYSIFKVLPFTSSDNLFEPQNEEDLMNILDDIKDFSTNYLKRQEAAEQTRIKREDGYNNLVMTMVADNVVNEDKFEDFLQKFPDQQFESLRQKGKIYFRKFKSEPKLEIPVTHIKKSTSFGDEQEVFKTFNSGSEEFFDFKDSAGLQDMITQKDHINHELQAKVKEANDKYAVQCQQIKDLQQQIELLRRVEEKCQKQHNKKALLLVKGRD